MLFRSIGAAVGEWISVARRKDDAWYIGSITNWTARDVKINFDFLGAGNFIAEIYADTDNTDENPNHLTLKSIPVNRNTELLMHLAKGGGQAIRVRRAP